MKMKIKGIIINPNNKTITESSVTVNLQSLYKIIGCKRIEAFCSPSLNAKDCFLYVDAAGLLKDNFYFKVDDTHIAGTAILFGGNKSGIDESAKMSIDEVRRIVSWQGFQKVDSQRCTSQLVQPNVDSKEVHFSIQFVSLIAGIEIEDLEKMIADGKVIAKQNGNTWHLSGTEFEKLLYPES